MKKILFALTLLAITLLSVPSYSGIYSCILGGETENCKKENQGDIHCFCTLHEGEDCIGTKDPDSNRYIFCEIEPN